MITLVKEFTRSNNRKETEMSKRLRIVGVVLALVGLGFLIASGVAYTKVQSGYDSLDAFSASQNVTLSYNDDGQLIDRGTTEGAEAIMVLLVDDWGYGINEADLDPNDPVVNTATEYMFQMATIGYHVLHGTQTVVLVEDVEYNGEVFTAGTYDVAVEGKYWTDFDRSHPLEGPARSQAWSGTVHGLFAELGVGTITHSTLQIALALTGIMAAIGFTVLFAGLGLFWAAWTRKQTVPDTVDEMFPGREPAPTKA
jgi:hypothetical protein